MSTMSVYESQIANKVEIACQRIAPLWPLKNFVAANPYLGLSNQPFWKAHDTLGRISGSGLCMPRDYYRQQMARGRITRDDLAQALTELESPWDVSAFEHRLYSDTPPSARPLKLVTNVLSELDGQDWPSFVVERISRYCAAYFDEGQAVWATPWKDTPLYSGWRAFALLDKSPRVMGVRGLRQALTTWPDTAEGAIVSALDKLNVPIQAVDDYLHAALLSIGGWAGWTRYLRWQAELQGNRDDSIRDLLAIRLTWDALLYQLRCSKEFEMRWRQSLDEISLAADRPDIRFQIDAILQTAFEVGYQRQLATCLTNPQDAVPINDRPDAQVVFCIDVRSEVYRRALETVNPRIQTLGFAGFFGIPMEFLPFGALAGEAHLPILFNPSYRIAESLGKENELESRKQMARRYTRIRMAKAWKLFKTSAASTFGFVEAAGLLLGPKLISDSMGWTRSAPRPEHVGLPTRVHERLKPVLTAIEVPSEAYSNGGSTGIPEDDRPATAELLLRNMGMTQGFARLVLFVGHASTTTNNPQATSLDCGACGGQSGEVNARIAAALLNDPVTRRGLARKSIAIPEDTHFIAGLHNTTTDEIRLFDTSEVPLSHVNDVQQLHDWLESAGQTTRLERALSLGIRDTSLPTIGAQIRSRARNWAQLRPEWALAGNAALIVAPRIRTRECNLAGRVFLHDYNWHHDSDFSTLELIMTAPMIVANWINLQYYGSMVDNLRLGSGNKVLHNVVGGSIGVLEGNGGDLRVGLGLQSLHDGVRWMHEPLRLNVIIEAPQDAIDNVIAHHDRVRELTDNTWIHLFQLDDAGHVNRRVGHKHWRPYYHRHPK